MNPVLFPFAVTCTALYLGLGLLPFEAAGISWGEALALMPDHVTASGIPVLPLLLALPLGFFWQGTVWLRKQSARPAAAAGVLLMLCLLAVLLRLGQAYFPPGLATPAGLFVPLLGFIAGMGLWWLFGPNLSRRLPGEPEWLWSTLIGVAALSILLPIDLGTPLNAVAPPESLSSYLADIPQRFYALIKSAMLWVPIGFLYTLSGRGAALPRWGIALVAALFLEGLPLLRDQPVRELVELLLALPGLWAGAWLAAHSLPGQLTLAMPVPRERQELSTSPGVSERGEPAARFASNIPRYPRREEEADVPAHAPTSTLSEMATPVNFPSEPESTQRRSHHSHNHRKVHSRTRAGGNPDPLRLLAGITALLAAIIGVASLPLWQLGIALGLLAYMAALWIWPLAWLVVVPAALPLLDLAPWTGRFFLDEFDLLILATAGTIWLRGRNWPRAKLTPMWPYFALCGTSLLISLQLGLGAPPPLDANAFSSYWSPYNSLRVAKGFVWGGLLFMLLRLCRPDPARLASHLALGMGIGLLGVGLVGLWERWLFAGFADDAHPYRIVSTFSSMHTGGGHIEAYLAAALPFLWLGMANWKTRLLAIPAMALTVYVMIFTVARGGVLALGVVLLTLGLASLRQAWRSGQRRQAILPMTVLTLLAAGLLAGIGGGYFQKRLATVGEDWQIRVDHWRGAASMMDSTPMAQLFGMGLGSFPRIYLERGPADKQPAPFGFLVEKDNTFLRLGGGDTLYYAQRVAARAGEQYDLELQARSLQGGARIETPVCEKQLLNSRRCVWMAFDVPGDGQWHRLSHEFFSGEVGIEDGLRRPPVELFLYYPGKTGEIDVDNIRLLDADGANLLGNGGFSSGGDYWFFKTHSHLPWHIKNVWVHVLFEQGWLGLLLFTALVAYTLIRLARKAWSGEPLAWAWLAALLGLLSVGMFDSLLDAPRLATPLILLCLLGAAYDWDTKPLTRRRHKRHARQSPHPEERLPTPEDVPSPEVENLNQTSTPSAR